MQTIEKIKQTTNPNLDITGLVRTMYDTRNNLSNEVSVQLLKYFSHKVFKTMSPLTPLLPALLVDSVMEPESVPVL